KDGWLAQAWAGHLQLVTKELDIRAVIPKQLRLPKFSDHLKHRLEHRFGGLAMSSIKDRAIAKGVLEEDLRPLFFVPPASRQDFFRRLCAEGSRQTATTDIPTTVITDQDILESLTGRQLVVLPPSPLNSQTLPAPYGLPRTSYMYEVIDVATPY